MTQQASPPVPPPASDYKNAKADAKAAKAYAKAQRPWYKKKRFIFLIAAAVIMAIIVGTSMSGGDTTANPSDPSTSTSPSADAPSADAPVSDAPAAAEGPTATFPMQDGDWRLESYKAKDDGLGDFAGRARITYTGDDADGGSNLFTITVFKNGDDIASVQGSASDVKPGGTVTVDTFSQDKFKKGPYTYDFQNDL